MHRKEEEAKVSESLRDGRSLEERAREMEGREGVIMAVSKGRRERVQPTLIKPFNW